MNRRQFLAACAATTLPVAAAGSEVSVVARRLRWTITVENPNAEVVRDARVFLYAPVRTSSNQKLMNLTVSGNHHIGTDTWGNTIVELAYPQFAPFASAVVAFDALVQVQANPVSEPLPERQIWLVAEPLIEKDAPDIQALAGKLTRDSDELTVLAIYDWVSRNVSYAGYIADDMGALYALNMRRGDCTEYAYLVTALARAAGIPARPIGGYVVEHDSVLRANEYHNWAELYFDGAWQPIDAQKGSCRANSDRYVAFEIISGTAQNALKGSHRYAIEGNLKVRLG